LDSLEEQCGVHLPTELRAAWTAANGADAIIFARPGYLTGYNFLSVAEALEERESMKDRAPGYVGYIEPKPRDSRIRAGWFQPGWLPFGNFGGGTLLLILDLAPAESGSMGQVIAFTHDPDRIDYVAPTFERFLGASLAAIEADPGEFIGAPYF
jgi:cell wall assembly regulator SMI1